MEKILLLLFFTVSFYSSLKGQGILLDENFGDWTSIDTLYSDSDDVSSGINFSTFKITNDNKFIYFYLEVGEEINLQDFNNITLYIDTDNNSDTGIEEFGFGYELEFTFGARSGNIYLNGSDVVSAYDIGLVSSPTVTSTVFEFKLNLETKVDGISLFSSDTISLKITGGNDQLPDQGEVLAYQFIPKDFQPESFTLKKPQQALRVLSYNVLTDNLFESNLQDNFQRIFRAIDPDIIGLQEVYNNSGEEAAQLMESFLPSSDDEQWYSGDTGNDNLIVSRYPVVDQVPINGNAAYLLEYGEETMLVIVAHPPCCTNNAGRQDEFDAIMAFVRDSKSGKEFDLKENSPIIFLGDMNLVGFAQQQKTLLTGDIVNEQQYGPDFIPDWDGTSLDDTKPSNPNLPTTYTWYSANGSFSPGRLDYIVYTGSQLELTNSFSLYTPAVPGDTLEAYNLQAEDVILVSDHLPVVADFTNIIPVSSEVQTDFPGAFQLNQNHPNPFNPNTVISFELSGPENVSLTIHNISGQKVASVINNKRYSAGQFSVTFNAEGLSSGVYFYQLSNGSSVITKKMMLIK